MFAVMGLAENRRVCEGVAASAGVEAGRLGIECRRRRWSNVRCGAVKSAYTVLLRTTATQ